MIVLNAFLKFDKDKEWDDLIQRSLGF